MPSLQYKYPRIYDIGIRITHRPKVLKEFYKAVGSKVSVFDVAAGYGGMSRYISSENLYSGIDLNDISLRYAKKHGINIRKGNIFDQTAYTKSDVLILVDVVHHINPDKLSALFDLVFTNSQKRVVIMEPAFVNLQAKYGFLGKIIDKILMKLDDDGVNKIDNWYSESEYLALIKGRFGSKHGKDFSVTTKKINPYYLIIYTRK